jgi:hypothetical protein
VSKSHDSNRGAQVSREFVSAEDMAWRLADALRRVLYGADDGTTHVDRVQVAIEAVETYDRWHAELAAKSSPVYDRCDAHGTLFLRGEECPGCEALA